MGAVLYQETATGERRLISCSSAKLNKAQRKYHCNEQEVLAAVWACRKYRALLEGRPFVLRTDSKALQWLDRVKDERAKLTRYSLLLQEFDYTVQHCPGRENQLPDYLSRHPEGEIHEVDEDRLVPPGEQSAVSEAPGERPMAVNKTARRPRRRAGRQHRQPRLPNVFTQPIQLRQLEIQDLPLYDQIAQSQRDSVEYQTTRVRWHRLQDGQEPVVHNWQRTLKDQYTVEDDLIWHVNGEAKALVVPLNFWQRVIHEYHDSIAAGHPGRDETLAAISRLYYWPAMRRQVKTHVRHCLICASTKRGGAIQGHAPLRPRPPKRPWEVLSIDVMGPYAETVRNKNRFLIVATDLCSKWVEAQAVTEAKAGNVTTFLDDICQRWGYPAATITDNAPVFRSHTWTRFHTKHDIESYTIPIYHQQANPVERRNQEIKKLLRIHVQNTGEDRWDQQLGTILFTLRNRINSATGVTPSEALLGAPLVRAGEWNHPEIRREVDNRADQRAARLRRIRQRQRVFNRRLYPTPRTAPIHFNVNEQVLVRTFPGVKASLGPTWTGPHPIVRVHGDGVYEVDRNGAQYKVHIDDLRRWPEPPPDELPARDPVLPPEDDDDDQSVEAPPSPPVIITVTPDLPGETTPHSVAPSSRRPAIRRPSPQEYDAIMLADDEPPSRPRRAPAPEVDSEDQINPVPGWTRAQVHVETLSTPDVATAPDDEWESWYVQSSPSPEGGQVRPPPSPHPVLVEDLADEEDYPPASPDAEPIIGLYP